MGKALSLQNWPPLLAASLLFLANVLLLAIRQKIFITYLNVKLNLWNSFLISMATVFFSAVFIFGTIGGDVARLYYLRRYTGLSYSKTGVVVLLDRLLGLSGLTVLIGIVQLYAILHGYNIHWDGSSAQLSLAYIFVLLPIVPIAGLLLFRLDIFNRLVLRFSQSTPYGDRLQGVMEAFRIYAHRRRLLLFCLLLSVISHGFVVFAISLLGYQSMGASGFWGAFFFSPLVLLSSAIPITPGNIGFTEAMADLVWRLFGAQGGANTLAIWRVVSTAVSLLGGLAFLRLGMFRKMSASNSN